MTIFRKSPIKRPDHPEVAVIDGTDIRIHLFGPARDARTDGLSGLTLSAGAPIEVVPVIGETVTVTFRVTGIERQERE